MHGLPSFPLPDRVCGIQMITYSLPLVYGSVVYGVVGVEVSTDHLNEYFPVRDLDTSLNAGYILAMKQKDASYHIFWWQKTMS